ncbi:UPF0056 inner membrane protein [Aureimonas sp. SA4125]|uniref:MarC family protein n=1 Tax=Aureimonas sp. SA4125 TaxID=2826993 RepID=UPI001CC65755|nr:MarC family protein [Aureimonas sp. SA4125]BDA84533.1 UPF0056 inner membrane protein [Aureimonas sp. SA4125]
MIELLVNGFVTLFVILDPLGLLPLFLTLTRGASAAKRRRIALKASLIAAGILLVFALFGLAILSGLGITLGAFRVAGGLFLFWIGFELVFEKRKERHERSATIAVEDRDEGEEDVAAFPLAIPLIAGPGAISATILLSGSLPTLAGQTGLVLVIVAALGINFGILALAHRVDHFLGRTGRAIISRLLGVLLAALAVQFVADGAAELARTTQATTPSSAPEAAGAPSG